MFSKFPFGTRLVAALRARRARRRFETWLNQQRSAGCFIDRRIDFIGRTEGYACVQIRPGVGIERDITIWISPDKGAHPELKLGERGFIGRHTYIGVFQPIIIGCRVLIGAYCYLISANHSIGRRDIPIVEQGFTGAPIIIEDDAWLGTHVVVLPGVTIGRGAVIGAGSVVTCNIPAWEIWGGVPARFIKSRPE
jgi:acetyltransferase-like isoleucine patch superfamily enzyme